MKTSRRTPLQSLWDACCSLNLTLFLLISLAVLSIIGTIIPQGTPPQEYLASISPNKLALYKALGFFDMYHSWWFILLLMLLTVNLIACSIKRLPHTWKIISQPETLLSKRLEQSLSNKITIRSAAESEWLKDKVTAFIRSEFTAPLVIEDNGAWHLFAQKAPWCRLSVYVVHLSVIVIFIGALIGSLFGYKAYVNIPEGGSVSKVVTRSDKEIDLGFSLRCEQFRVTKYPNGAPKEFKSILTILENGKPVPDYTNARVIVNDPLTYKGITFYQSSYGNAGDYFFNVTDLSGGNPVKLSINGNDTAQLADGSTMHIIEATSDISQFMPEFSGPAAQVELHTSTGGTEQFVVFANHPEQNIKHAQEHNKGPVSHYLGSEERMYTGLQVAKDPGVWVVWIGCFLMIAGIYAAFFLSHRRIWVRIDSKCVTIGGNSSKNQGAFQQYFNDFSDKLEHHLSTEERQ